MNTKHAQDQGWQDCPTGTLDQVVQHGQMTHRMQTLGKVTAFGTASCVLLVAYAILFTNPAQPSLHGDLTCQKVEELIDDFKAGRIDPELATRIQNHLDQCVACGGNLVSHLSSDTIAATSDQSCSCAGCQTSVTRHVDPPTLFATQVFQP